MQSLNISHRDLKLENILIDNDFNLKVADFGFATFKKGGGLLNSYRGTQTYMAPEIKEGKPYSGEKVDLFSAGVILFILARGIFPFKEAKPDDNFYKYIHQKDFKGYWSKVESESLSDNLKDLLLKLLCYNDEERISLEDLKSHPWL